MRRKELTLKKERYKTIKMDIQAIKLDIMEKLLIMKKETVLDQINKLLEKETIVAYSVTGEPLTRQEYNDNLAEGERQIAEGNCMTQEELEKDIENW